MSESTEKRIPSERDSWLLLVTVLLVGTGLIFVLSASQALAINQHLSALYYFQRQIVAVALGGTAMFVLMRFDYHRLRSYAVPGAIIATILLILVPLVGVQVNGARRWFNIGPAVIQPTEIAKIALALFVADWVSRRGARLRNFEQGFLPFVVILSVAVGLVMLEKDLGTAFVIAAILVGGYFAGGGRKRYLLLLFLGLGAIFAIDVVVEPYRAARLVAFLHPFNDPLGGGFQSTQGIYALGSGGIFGVGIGHSVQKFLWLPESHTDFIFAIIGEETGLIGTTGVLLAFVYFIYRGYRAALRAPDKLGVVLAAAMTTWIGFQALINMATVTDTLPITGIPLPLISYGGSSVATTLAAIGILLNVASQGTRTPVNDSLRRSDATVDIGGRDRRSPVPGAGRRTNLPR